MGGGLDLVYTKWKKRKLEYFLYSMSPLKSNGKVEKNDGKYNEKGLFKIR